MTLEPDLLRSIRANAASVISELGPLSDVDGFGFNKESVAWVEGFIERQRQFGGEHQGDNRLIDVIGSFLGEAIIAQSGGEWELTDEGGLGVVFDSGAAAFPFNKVAKQFSLGLEGGEIILGFYDFSTEQAAKGRFGQ